MGSTSNVPAYESHLKPLGFLKQFFEPSNVKPFKLMDSTIIHLALLRLWNTPYFSRPIFGNRSLDKCLF